MNEYKVIITEEANYDINNIADFFYEKAGAKSYENLLQLVRNTVNNLSKKPQINRRFSDEFEESVRRVIVPNKKVGIIYKIYNKELEVIAVLGYHTMSNPDVYKSIISQRIKQQDKLHISNK